MDKISPKTRNTQLATVFPYSSLPTLVKYDFTTEHAETTEINKNNY